MRISRNNHSSSSEVNVYSICIINMNDIFLLMVVECGSLTSVVRYTLFLLFSQQVKLNLDEAMEDLSHRLDQRRQIRARKRSLQSLARVQSSLSKWSVLLHLDENSKDEELERKKERPPLDPGLVERAASEFNQLQFCISKCENDLAESHKQVMGSTRYKDTPFNTNYSTNKYIQYCNQK